MNKIVLNINSKKRIIDFNEIVYITTLDRKTILVYSEGKNIKTNYSLNDIERKIENDRFVRCHKSFIVNVNYIKSFNESNGILKNDMTVSIGRSYRKDFEKVIYSMNV